MDNNKTLTCMKAVKSFMREDNYQNKVAALDKKSLATFPTSPFAISWNLAGHVWRLEGQGYAMIDIESTIIALAKNVPSVAQNEGSELKNGAQNLIRFGRLHDFEAVSMLLDATIKQVERLNSETT